MLGQQHGFTAQRDAAERQHLRTIEIPAPRGNIYDRNGSDLIYDWNLHQAAPVEGRRPAQIDDETLRDGLQNPTVKDPPIERKIEMLHLIAEMGIQAADSSNLAASGSTLVAGKAPLGTGPGRMVSWVRGAPW